MHCRKAACRLANIEWKFFYWLLIVGFLLTVNACADEAGAIPVYGKKTDSIEFPPSFGLGRPATIAEIEAWDIDIGPDGKDLPAGSGNAAIGKNIYALKCAACHGNTGREGPQNKLVGAMGDTTKAKTIGNYWPYATTLFDYLRRTMPYNAPGSLQNDEVYSLVAFLLSENSIIDSSVIMNKETLPSVKMPAQSLLVPDDRRGGPEIR